MFGTGRKKEAAEKQGTPTDLVLQMRQQTLSNNQIIQNLQRMGYHPTEIFDAMNQADLKSGIEAAPISGFSPDQIENPMDFGKSSTARPAMSPAMVAQGLPPAGMPPFQMPPSGPGQMAPPGFPPGQATPAFIPPGPIGISKEEVEELIETIIDEKWAEIAGNINKIVEWKNKVEARIAAIDEQIKDIQKQFDDLRQSVLSKVGEYDQHIVSVGTDVKAMEQVFQKMLPLFAENVRELSRITDSLKAVGASQQSAKEQAGPAQQQGISDRKR